MAITFTTYSQPDDMAAALQDFIFDNPEALQGDTRTMMRNILRPGGSVSFSIAYAVELIYARREEIDSPELLQLAASGAAYGALYGVDNLGGERGNQISLRLRKQSGEKAPVGGWQLSSEDPEPRADYVRVEEEPPVTEE